MLKVIMKLLESRSISWVKQTQIWTLNSQVKLCSSPHSKHILENEIESWSKWKKKVLKILEKWDKWYSREIKKFIGWESKFSSCNHNARIFNSKLWPQKQLHQSLSDLQVLSLKQFLQLRFLNRLLKLEIESQNKSHLQMMKRL